VDPVIRYIESESGDTFVICLEILSRHFAEYDIESRLEIDGKVVQTGICRKESARHEDFHFKISSCVARKDGVDTTQTFKFSNLVLGKQDKAYCGQKAADIIKDENEEHLDDETKKSLASAGSISLQFSLVASVEEDSPRTILAPSLQEFGKLPEKAVKKTLVSHSTMFVALLASMPSTA
jgi:hypothetical protein